MQFIYLMFDFFFLATIFWKSILKTRKVISQGAIWHVGDRCDIQILRINGYLELEKVVAVCYPQISSNLVCVSHLIDPYLN